MRAKDSVYAGNIKRGSIWDGYRKCGAAACVRKKGDPLCIHRIATSSYLVSKQPAWEVNVLHPPFVESRQILL